jgi:GTP-binding protein
MSKPIVAIVGRQNTGKSTLLNRMAGRPLAIVEDMPGTTRDRVFADVTWQGASFTLVDTGGLEFEIASTVARGVRAQIESAISAADVIVSLVDVRDPVTPADMDIADMLRRAGKPVLLVANKADNAKLDGEAVEYYQLGLGEPLPVSAHHGRGIAELMDRIAALLPPPPPAPPDTAAIKVAIVGRPNVGKSMLLNTLVGDRRSIVDESPGTTRDALDTLFDFNGQSVLLIDTAGIRRRGRVASGVERYSVIRALRAIERADVVLLVLDATEPVTAQDTHIAGYIQQAAKGIALIVNKWDLVENKDTALRSNHVYLGQNGGGSQEDYAPGPADLSGEAEETAHHQGQ